MLLLGPLAFPATAFRKHACRGCGTHFAWESDELRVLGRPTRSTYRNPVGLVCEVLTVRRVSNVSVVGYFTDEATWFEGYAWSPATCGMCGRHVGWEYEALDARMDPVGFYGLLVAGIKTVAVR